MWQLRGIPLGRLNALEVAMRGLSLLDLNVLLFRSDTEERDSTRAYPSPIPTCRHTSGLLMARATPGVPGRRTRGGGGAGDEDLHAIGHRRE